MYILTTVSGVKTLIRSFKPHQTIGLIPTMGFLHAGHLSLIKRSLLENQFTIVSIFVNPLQFTPSEDLDEYPRQFEQDCQLCAELGVNAIFAPTPETLGVSGNSTSDLKNLTTVVPPEILTKHLCGEFRLGHFAGVATIVTKLLTLIQPTVAYFGEKDRQQLVIIRHLVADLNLPVKIQGCPTIREPSGLAYSSRNQYLSKTEKEKALTLYKSLSVAKNAFEQGEKSPKVLLHLIRQEFAQIPDIKLQYAELVDPKTLIPLERLENQGILAIAAYVGSTRLIDNMLLCDHSPIIAIDGPAGAGKSTVTRQIAQQLNLLYLDTGAMYRGITWWIMEKGISLGDEIAIADQLEGLTLELVPDKNGVKINGQDVSEIIRSPEITKNVSQVAAQAAVRQFLVNVQQKYGEKGGLVAEGRDIGTHVFPNAELKIFLTASVKERAKRRLKDFSEQGYEEQLDTLMQEIQQRDDFDSNRAISPLRQAEDAIRIETDHLTIEEVVQQIIASYKNLNSTI
ncbi:MAG: bifunctional pantoate--beta-alanine ligase/(d)CMP kinase [Microcystaceae cyanobacterium]